jgi:hypothetical protein
LDNSVYTDNERSWMQASRLLVRFNIQTLYIPTIKKAHLLGPTKDDFGRKIPDISFECSKMYGWQTGCAIKMTCNEHDTCSNQVAQQWQSTE